MVYRSFSLNKFANKPAVNLLAEDLLVNQVFDFLINSYFVLFAVITRIEIFWNEYCRQDILMMGLNRDIGIKLVKSVKFSPRETSSSKNKNKIGAIRPHFLLTRQLN